jgi:endonuclease YncB( thermonuclease family)
MHCYLARLFEFTVVAASLGAVWAPAGAAELLPGPVPARVERVIDGDTLDVRAAIWLDQWVSVRVRIDGVDAPEMRGSCAAERSRAAEARAYLARRLMGTEVRLTAIAYDKYGGRVRAMVSDATGDIAAALIAKGYARAYHGRRRASWCAPP